MRLFVPLTRDEFDRLHEMARVERRRPQEQAAILIARALDTPSTVPPERGTDDIAPKQVTLGSHVALAEAWP